MAGKLTDLAVKAAKPRERRYTLFDSGGLYLEIAPNGGKWWRFRYRFDGRQRVMSFGTYPVTSLKNARDKRDLARVAIARGQDPQDEKNRDEGAARQPTFGEVLDEWFAKKSVQWSAAYTRSNRLRINKYLAPTLYARPFSELDTRDFLDVLRPIERMEKFETAKRIAQICGQVCRYARIAGIIKTNPVDGVSEILIPPKVTHQAAITEPSKVAHLLRDIQHYPGRPVTGFALRIMPYVFVRSGELRGARWEEIDFKNRVWVIPAGRMKMRIRHVVPLAPQVIALFDELRLFSGKSALCFPSRMSNTQPITDMALLNSLRRMGYERGEMCIHGFRSMASTLLNEMGYRPDIIEAQLAHKEQDAIRAAYNRAQYMEERVKMMREWADYLDRLRDGK